MLVSANQNMNKNSSASFGQEISLFPRFCSLKVDQCSHLSFQTPAIFAGDKLC